MKKQMIISVLAVACMTLHGNWFTRTSATSEKAWELQLNTLRFMYAADDQHLPTTRLVNGAVLSQWLENRGDMENIDKVYIVEQDEDGTFLQRGKLTDFHRRDLVHWYESTDANGNLLVNFQSSSGGFEHLALVQALKMGRCVLCEDSDKAVIVMHAKEDPKKVCDKLKATQIK